MGSATLVTGAAGFIGGHLLTALGRTEGVIAWHQPDTPVHDRPGVKWMPVELLDRAAVEAALRESHPGAIYHLAGLAHVGDSWALAESTMAANAVGTAHLFDALDALSQRPRVLVTGSAAIYTPSAEPMTEETPLAPNTPYGTSKLAQEMVALAACRDRGVPVVVTRSFNQIGPGQSPSFAAASFARQLARIEAGVAPPALTVGNLEAQRDISDVRDTVRAYLALMAGGRSGECYNVCAGRARSMQEVVDGLVRRVGRAVEVVCDPARMRPSDTPRVVGSHAKLTRDTGWAPAISFDDTLDALMEFWRQEVRAGRA